MPSIAYRWQIALVPNSAAPALVTGLPIPALRDDSFLAATISVTCAFLVGVTVCMRFLCRCPQP